MRGHLLVGSSPLGIIPRIMNEIRGNKILDVGCGCGVYGYLLRNKWQDTPSGMMQFQNFAERDPQNDQPALLVGVDVQLGSVRRCAKHSIYDFLALSKAQSLPFPDDYVDTILCIEVLEHLSKEDALAALRGFDRIATRRIIITVPKLSLSPLSGTDERDFVNLKTDDPEVLEWVEAETHKSSFSIQELSRMGFRIGRRVRGGWRYPIDVARKVWQNYGYNSGQILAVKDLNKNVQVTPEASVPPAPRVTEGFPDYR
jgi:ubiquinone/menaquinone biosynthesis C-methylase UbiE